MKTTTAVISFVLLFACSGVMAEEAPLENPFSVKFKGHYSPASDLEHQSGDVLISKLSLRLGYKMKLKNGQPFWVNIGPDHYIISDESAANIPSEMKSRGIRMGTEIGMPFVSDERYALGAEINPTFQTAKDVAFAGEAFRFNFSTYAKFRGTDDFEWVVGARIRPEYHIVAIPIFGINYKVNDKVFINLVSDSPKISYLLTEQTKLNVDFDYTFDEFEITDNDAPNRGAIVDYQEFLTGLSVSHEFNEHVNAAVGAGAALNRVIKFQDGTGKAVLKDGIYISLRFNAKF